MRLVFILSVVVLGMLWTSSVRSGSIEIYFDESLTEASFCGYENMEGDTLRLYMVAEQVDTVSGAVLAIRGSFCNLCVWDIRGTHYPEWVESWDGVPLDTYGAEIHGEPQAGPKVLLAILDAVFVDPSEDESTPACSAAPEAGPNTGLLGWWDAGGEFFPADSACGWVYRQCQPTGNMTTTWGRMKSSTLED
ncbi:MAG: hypothetical protein GF355_08315 [Candidatus Eisenbacteria bacterium]|nr:hypothetical protein [Candidatus Eisenbacteria bacterium]